MRLQNDIDDNLNFCNCCVSNECELPRYQELVHIYSSLKSEAGVLGMSDRKQSTEQF